MSGYSQVYTYYAMLERILKLEFFKSRLASNVLDALKLEHSVMSGLPFWNTEGNDEYVNL